MRKTPFAMCFRAATDEGKNPFALRRAPEGNGRGLSYRSAIFYTSPEQKRTAAATIADVEASGLWPGKIVTEVSPAGAFWEAEPEHQDYLQRIQMAIPATSSAQTGNCPPEWSWAEWGQRSGVFTNGPRLSSNG